MVWLVWFGCLLVCCLFVFCLWFGCLHKNALSVGYERMEYATLMLLMFVVVAAISGFHELCVLRVFEQRVALVSVVCCCHCRKANLHSCWFCYCVVFVFVFVVVFVVCYGS